MRFEDTDGKARALERDLEHTIDAVESLDEDRILRGFLRAPDLRRPRRARTPALRRKLPLVQAALGRRAPDAGRAPLFEIFVYHPLVEGIHLRGGHVARGGIRWSDRREDYRSEVLGLMKAQTVKNAVIVPVGAKGGFVLARPRRSRSRRAARGGAAVLPTLIRGMLDVTDNIVGGEVVPPAGRARIRRGRSVSRRGRRQGHRRALGHGQRDRDRVRLLARRRVRLRRLRRLRPQGAGITARGAWESVKRHFRELGRDVESARFTVAGIGDMSGDVFGNGMLLSRQIQLVAAFDHRHVFLDPSPDPAACFAERERLFALARARRGWTTTGR